MSRLQPQPGERIDRGRPLRFTFDGDPVSAYEGDTIVSALYAAGHRVFSRSFKYHRPRGEICACGQCANSLVAVDGAPGVRACAEPVRDGMEVTHLNAWPSLSFDAMRVVDLLGRPLTPVGFYYKTFISPRRLWPLYEKALRHAAGRGRLPVSQRRREWLTEHRHVHCDVLVVGGGLAGLSAAIAAAELGAQVLLCEQDVEPGGASLAEGGHQRAKALVEHARRAGVQILSRACALGCFDGLVPVAQDATLHRVRADQRVIATGAIQQPLLFEGNDLPGVMLSGAARRLGALYAVRSGAVAVVATVDDRGLRDALALVEMGVEVRAVVHRHGACPEELREELRAAGVEVLCCAIALRARGRQRLRAVVLGQEGRRGSSRKTVRCDLLAVSGGAAPALSLLLQGGAQATYDPAMAAFLPRRLPPTLHAAGAVAGAGEREQAERSGAACGEAAVAGLRGTGRRRPGWDGAKSATPVASSTALTADARGGRAFVDLDEDVTVKDVRQAVREGFDSLELAKRYTTATMGPSQGRFSQLPAARLVAEQTGLDLATVGLTTARPPWSSVPLGLLAGRSSLQPVRRSPLHACHCELDALIRLADGWLRPQGYGDRDAEMRAVEQAAGMIDVSMQSRLIVRGPDACELLERACPSHVASLPPGRLRRSVLLSDSGRIKDECAICRLDEHIFYLTGIPGSAAAIERGLEQAIVLRGLDACLADVTEGTAAIGLVGPRAQTVLGALADVGLRGEGLGHLETCEADVASIHCLLLRIGSLALPSYEIHCAAGHGSALWQSLLRAGAEHGLRPFGVHAQRALRLQRLQVAVGQDTDSESTPEAAGLCSTVDRDKPQDFVGGLALKHGRGRSSERLIGFSCPGGHMPAQGSPIVVAGAAAGEVRSVCRTPRFGVIGIAQVPKALAIDGATVTVSDAGRSILATLTTQPFFDPAGQAPPPGEEGAARRSRTPRRVSCEFLRLAGAAGAAGAAGPARSPLADRSLSGQALIVRRDGFEVVASYGEPAAEVAACKSAVAWADLSYLPKALLTGASPWLRQFRGGLATPRGEGWCCPLTPQRALLLGRTGPPPGGALLELTCSLAAIVLVGPAAKQVIAGLSAVDLRPESLPVGGFWPGSLARVPGYLLREAESRFLLLFGASFGVYMWDVLSEAGERLGGAPAGMEALAGHSADAEALARPSRG